MTRQYPRGYLIVEKGEIVKVTVKDPVHELAVILAHEEAVGTNPPEEYDHSQDVIEDD